MEIISKVFTNLNQEVVNNMAHLPGQNVSIQDDEWGTTCHHHPEIKATHRICSEDDSFGAEYTNMCDECWDVRTAAIQAIADDETQWETCKCGNREPELIQYRDMDEGMHGPVYEHCSGCHAKMNARIEAEYGDVDDDEYYDECCEDDFADYEGLGDDRPTAHDLSFGDLTDINKVLHDNGFNLAIEGSTLVSPELDRRAYARIKDKLKDFLNDNTEDDFLKYETFSSASMTEIHVTISVQLLNGREVIHTGTVGKPRSITELVRNMQGKGKNVKLGKHTSPTFKLVLLLAEYY